MEAVVITALICTLVSGGVLLEALAPHLPTLLGLHGGGATRGRRGAPVRRGRERSTVALERQVTLERRVEALQAERDFYRALVDRPGDGPDEADRGGRTTP
jgi:hypothetical protein